MATMIWCRSSKAKQRTAPCPRLTKPEMMAATWSAPASSSDSDRAISRPSADTATASATPLVPFTKLFNRKLNRLASSWTLTAHHLSLHPRRAVDLPTPSAGPESHVGLRPHFSGTGSALRRTLSALVRPGPLGAGLQAGEQVADRLGGVGVGLDRPVPGTGAGGPHLGVGDAGAPDPSLVPGVGGAPVGVGRRALETLAGRGRDGI